VPSVTPSFPIQMYGVNFGRVFFSKTNKKKTLSFFFSFFLANFDKLEENRVEGKTDACLIYTFDRDFALLCLIEKC